MHRDLNDKAVTGATVYSIEDGEYGVAEGSRRSQGWFYLDAGNVDEPMQRVVCVDSPIEAIALRVLEQPARGKTLYLAVSSGDRWAERLATVPEVVIASRSLIETLKSSVLPGVSSQFPQGRNWQQALQDSSQLAAMQLEQSAGSLGI